MSSPPSGLADRTVADFVGGLTRSRLVGEERAQQLLAEWATVDVTKLADHLVRTEAITRFQAEKVLRGHWRGLRLGKYLVLCPVGRGGVGVVYLAQLADERDSPTRELFAVKVLPPQRAAEPRTLIRFQREAEIGLKLPAHPHLTRTIEAGEQGGVHFLVMEYVPGPTLRQTVVEGGVLLPGRAARVFADVAAGLHQAHLAGFVHRDFKPSNVILTPTGRAKLLDFGFALWRGEASPSDPSILGGQGYTMGTMDYIAPEQTANAVEVGPAADLYSLGCSLFFALTGSPPFPGGGTQDKIRWHRSQNPPRAIEFNPTIPVELSQLVTELLAKNPAERPPTAEEAARRLAAFADPVRATPLNETGAGTAELLRAVDARWQVQRASGDADPADESFQPADAGSTVERAPPPPPGMAGEQDVIRVTKPAMVAAAGVFVLAILLAVVLGWVLARL